MRHPQQAVVTLPPDTRSAADARRFVRRTLSAWACDAETTDNTELLVSELVANALRHAGTGVRLRLAWQDDGVRVDVADGSRRTPRPRLPDTVGEAGRGLFLVDQLARDWGVREHDSGKSVWFLLAPLSRAGPAR